MKKNEYHLWVKRIGIMQEIETGDKRDKGDRKTNQKDR